MAVESKKTTKLIHGFWYLFLGIVGITMIAPFLWMMSKSLSPSASMKVHDNWYENLLPGDEVTWMNLDGQPIRVKKLETKNDKLLVRIIETGPRDKSIIKLSPEKVIEEDVKFLLTDHNWYSSYEPKTEANAVKARLFRTKSKKGDPVTLPRYILKERPRPDTFLEEDGKWIKVKEQRRDVWAIEWRVVDLHPRFGEELEASPDEVHQEWQQKFAFGNFAKAWNKVNLGRGYFNSVAIAILVTLGQVFTSSMAAYAFARLRFKGRDVLFFGYLATMMIPGAVTMIPIYILFAKGPAVLNQLLNTTFMTSDLFLFRWLEIGKPLGIDSYMALILPGLFSAYGTFMLRQFFMSIPRDLEDAARIDGCSTFGTYWKIVIPMSKPALAALTIFTFVGNWKSFMWPLIVCQSESLRTLPVMLAYFQGEYRAEYHLMMAGSMMVLLPMIVVFIIGQRYFVSGIRLGALKG